LKRSDTVLTRTSEVWAWYDFVTVEFELDNAPDYATLVDDNNRYPAKLIGFYRLLSREVDEEQSEFQVLTHCVAFQRLDSEIYKKGLLVRPWMYEVTAGRHQDRCTA
jgi:hypothetical protein